MPREPSTTAICLSNTSGAPASIITGATLKLYATSAASLSVKPVSNTTWGETTITYANAPAMGSTALSTVTTTANAYTSFTVIAGVSSRGLVSFGVTTTATSPVTVQSLQGTNKPQLVVTSAPVDSAAPSAPANLAANVVSDREIDLAWSASTDNVGVAGYHIYRDGTQINTGTPNNLVASTSWYDIGLAANSITRM